MDAITKKKYKAYKKIVNVLKDNEFVIAYLTAVTEMRNIEISEIHKGIKK